MRQTGQIQDLDKVLRLGQTSRQVPLLQYLIPIETLSLLRNWEDTSHRRREQRLPGQRRHAMSTTHGPKIMNKSATRKQKGATTMRSVSVLQCVGAAGVWCVFCDTCAYCALHNTLHTHLTHDGHLSSADTLRQTWSAQAMPACCKQTEVGQHCRRQLLLKWSKNLNNHRNDIVNSHALAAEKHKN